MHRLVELDPGAERGDHDRHLPLDHDLEIALEPHIRAMHNLVDRIGRGGAVGIGLVVAVKLLGDVLEPTVELDRLALLLAGVERREAAGDTGLALGEHERRVLDDEQRRAEGGDAQVLQDRRQGHRLDLSLYDQRIQRQATIGQRTDRVHLDALDSIPVGRGEEGEPGNRLG